MKQSGFMEHLYYVTGIPMAVYTAEGEARECFCPDQAEYEAQILQDGGVAALIREMDGQDLLVRDVSENVWMTLVRITASGAKGNGNGVSGIKRSGNGASDLFCVMGPSALSNNEVKRKNLPVFQHRQYAELIILVYEHFTGKTLTAAELFDLRDHNEEKLAQWRGRTIENLLTLQENKRRHHDLAQEKRLLDTIRQGKADEFMKIYIEPIGGSYGVLAKNKVRSNRNLAISIITLFTRAAIDGGVNSERALTMSDAYINQIETMDKWEDLYVFCREAGRKFAEMAAQKQQRLQFHLLVDRCEKMIAARIHERITVKELAGALSVNADYLSRLFHESTGMTIGAYIQQEKISLARNMLIYSQFPLEEIANYLGFASQSHFGRIFKKFTGLTPGQYRKLYMPEAFLNREDNILN